MREEGTVWGTDCAARQEQVIRVRKEPSARRLQVNTEGIKTDTAFTVKTEASPTIQSYCPKIYTVHS